jgi:two-component system cell cycle sensor histidine kinase/response regulator CckA
MRSHESEHRRPVILVVDDDPSLLVLMKELLQRYGYKVLAAGSGQEASDMAQNAIIDLLIADVVMPQITGPQLAERLQARRPELPVMLLSGYPQPQLASNWRFIQKPFATRELIAGVADVLRAPQTQVGRTPPLKQPRRKPFTKETGITRSGLREKRH